MAEQSAVIYFYLFSFEQTYISANLLSDLMVLIS